MTITLFPNLKLEMNHDLPFIPRIWGSGTPEIPSLAFFTDILRGVVLWPYLVVIRTCSWLCIPGSTGDPNTVREPNQVGDIQTK